jgi:malonate transporter
LALPVPMPVNEFLGLLGAAATPCALFAIGASLAGRGRSGWAWRAGCRFAKLVLHPALVAIAALGIFPGRPVGRGVMIAAASLPVAGNVYILAQHYGVAPQRVSTAILISRRPAS